MKDTPAMLPRIHLISRPAFNAREFLAFLAGRNLSWNRTTHAKDAEEIVESAGRLCYMSFGAKQSQKSNAEFVHDLVRRGHESVLEHISWSMILVGVTRSFTHQLVRHRVGFSFSQLSQQYHEDVEPTFGMPSVLDRYGEARSAWQASTKSAKEAYRKILEILIRGEMAGKKGWSRGELERYVRSAARSVLPNATQSIVFMTVNARAARHFLSLRGGIVGDEEMREVACVLLEVLRKEAPAVFGDFEIRQLSHGMRTVTKKPQRELFPNDVGEPEKMKR